MECFDSCRCNRVRMRDRDDAHTDASESSVFVDSISKTYLLVITAQVIVITRSHHIAAQNITTCHISG